MSTFYIPSIAQKSKTLSPAKIADTLGILSKSKRDIEKFWNELRAEAIGLNKETFNGEKYAVNVIPVDGSKKYDPEKLNKYFAKHKINASKFMSMSEPTYRLQIQEI